MTPEHLAKLQAGRAAAKDAKQHAEVSEDERCAALHKQAYIDLLRYRAQNEALKGKHLEPDFLNID